MGSLNFIIQVVLVVAFATLLAHHLQLRNKYEELKTSCEINCSQNDDISTKLKQTSKPNTKGSFVMQSSSKDKNERDDMTAIELNGFVEENEPTLDNKGSKEEDVSSESYTQGTSGDVFQTSNTEEQLSEPQASENSGGHLVDDLMAPTTDGDIDINPSQSLSVQITKKNAQIPEPIRQTNQQSLTQSSIHQIDPSMTDIQGSTHSQEKENAFEMYEKLKSVEEHSDELTAEYENDPDKRYLVEISSSDTTEEEEVIVHKTSQEKNIADGTNIFAYLTTQDSTSVFEAEYSPDSMYVMTETQSVYYAEDDEENCDLFECDEDESYEEKDVRMNYGSDNQNFLKQNEKMKEKSFDKLIMNLEKEDLFQFMDKGTSGWCGKKHQSVCSFKNLCYNTKENDFVFFKGENSILEIDGSEMDEDVFDINLSTIQGHNTKMFSVVTLPAILMEKFSIGIMQKQAVAFSRFKPDNIMHVLHDDILPLFHTLQQLNVAYQEHAFDAAIIFTDRYEEGDYIDFYSSLSTYFPISPWKLNQTYDLLCFPDIHLGLRTSTVWYQYGFFQPQGPVSPIEENILDSVHKAADILSAHFHSECFLCSKGNYLVFLRRKDNRLIVNEGELIMSLTQSTKLKIMSVSLETNTLSDIITIIRLSKGMIGMHGSLLSLAIFLPPGSVLIELFPFGVNPLKYTPFKTFCDLPGSGLVYKFWANPSKEKSVPHPDWPASEGGISHLPKYKQDEISAQTEVPEHLCCDDPSWLYHIYQDTHVDVNTVVSLVKEGISESGNSKKLMTQHDSPKQHSIDIPGSVRNLRCEKVVTQEPKLKSLSFVVSWDAPWVFSFDISSKDHKYEVVIQEENSDDNTRLLLHSDTLTYQFDSKSTKSDAAHNVWVRVSTNNGLKSQNKFIKCMR